MTSSLPAHALRRVVRVAAAALLLAPRPGAAQAPRTALGVHAGSLSHSLLGRVEGTLWGIGPNGLAVYADVEAEPATVLGGRFVRSLSGSLGLRVRIARLGTHMRLVADTRPIGGSGNQRYTFDGLGEVVVWIADVDVAWSPLGRSWPVSPYLFAGVGATNWDISGLDDLGALPPLLESPVNLSPVNAFLPGFLGGLGIEVGPFGRFSVELEVSDHVSGDPLDDDDFHIGTEFAGHGRAKDLVHNVALTAGARVRVGR